MSKKVSFKFYRCCFKVAGPVIRFFRPIEVHGRENFVSGAALICSNHSTLIDPFLIALALGIDMQVRVIAKISLFKIPVISTVLWKLGMIPVDRSITDVTSVKMSLSYLKSGDKVVIFPEGTRVSSFDANIAKKGAVKLAERAKVPIMPVFMPRKKPFFKKTKVIFGQSYYIQKTEEKKTADDYEKLSVELMEKIQSLDYDVN
jgi:1-acyl-sn-glycerol-3-phosphate acyltransferase